MVDTQKDFQLFIKKIYDIFTRKYSLLISLNLIEELFDLKITEEEILEKIAKNLIKREIKEELTSKILKREINEILNLKENQEIIYANKKIEIIGVKEIQREIFNEKSIDFTSLCISFNSFYSEKINNPLFTINSEDENLSNITTKKFLKGYFLSLNDNLIIKNGCSFILISYLNLLENESYLEKSMTLEKYLSIFIKNKLLPFLSTNLTESANSFIYLILLNDDFEFQFSFEFFDKKVNAFCLKSLHKFYFDFKDVLIIKKDEN